MTHTNGKKPYSVIDLFSGAGGMSLGFHRHPRFKLVAAADAELGKPSAGRGTLQCNSTYETNMGFRPSSVDLSAVAPEELPERLGLPSGFEVDVLSACPPCTGFSRAVPTNHLRDDHRNNLVRLSGMFAVTLSAKILVMENARELLRGNFTHHFNWLKAYLERNGYDVFGKNYMLTRFGLPQLRERAIVVAVKRPCRLRTIDDLWEGRSVSEDAIHVRRALLHAMQAPTGCDQFPEFATEAVRRRIAAIPQDGGSWISLLAQPGGEKLMTNAMRRIVESGRLGSYPDVYGRMRWDAPAPTIKRECAHVGNGRYTHPEEDRLCSVREMAVLQGFPNDFQFRSSSLSNAYRHIGDAVPPLISYQLAHLSHWILAERQPDVEDVLLPGSHLSKDDLTVQSQQELLLHA